jgi:hypothetical protein
MYRLFVLSNALLFHVRRIVVAIVMVVMLWLCFVCSYLEKVSQNFHLSSQNTCSLYTRDQC